MPFRSRAWPLSRAALVLAALTTISCAERKTQEVTTTRQPTEADLVARGEYLVRAFGCADCHTPGTFYGSADPKRLLSGSELGWRGWWGTVYARNLTPDTTTGIGLWTEQDIVNAIHQGRRANGTPLHPPMRWTNLVWLHEEDAYAIAKYLKTIPPIVHQVPDRLPPGATPKGAFLNLPPPSAWDAPRTK